MSSNVVMATRELKEMRKSIDRVEIQLQDDGKALAVLETLLGTIDRRVGELERRK